MLDLSHLWSRLVTLGGVLTALAFCASCGSSAAALSRRLDRGQVASAAEIIVLPARTVPVAFIQKEQAAHGGGSNPIAAMGADWHTKRWDVTQDALPEFNAGRAVSEACVAVLRSEAPELGAARSGPFWDLDEDEFNAVYAGTYAETVFSDRVYQRFHRYLGQGGITHSPEWVTSNYPHVTTNGRTIWLIEPFIAYALVGPSGFTFQVFFHVYDLELGAVLAQKYPGHNDVNWNHVPIGRQVERGAATGGHQGSSSIRTLFGAVGVDASVTTFTDADILAALDRAATDIARKGLIDLGLIEPAPAATESSHN